jgi:hypothetical protein
LFVADGDESAMNALPKPTSTEEGAHAAVEAAMVEAKRRVRINEEDAKRRR